MNKITVKNKRFNKIFLAFYLLVIIFFLIISFTPIRSYAAETPVWQVLKDYQNSASLGGKVYSIWKALINLTNGFVVVVLIAVALAQILRININTYGAKKILPTLVLAIIAANFSFLFCRLLVDFSSVVSSIFLNGADGNRTNAGDVIGALSNISKNIAMPKGGPCTSSVTTNCYTYGTLFWHGIGNLMMLAGAIVILILAYLFIVRNWLIYFFVSLAPLAIMALILPQTKSLFNQWWSNFAKWVFMPVVSLFWIWVGSQWFSLIGGQGTFMSFIFAGVCFYLAITTPFKMGGAVMTAWGNLGKRVTAPIGDFAKGQAGLLWSGQAAGGKWYNPLGHIARGQIALQDMKKFREEKTADNREKGLAGVMESRLHKGRTIAREKFGGDVERAKQRVIKGYQGTDAGKEWLKGREEWLNEGMVLEEQIKGNYSESRADYYKTPKGAKVVADLTRARQGALLHEDRIHDVEKDLMAKFFKRSKDGPFDNDEDKQLISDRILFLTRNLASDEVVKKAQQDEVDKVFQEQLHFNTMGEEAQSLRQKSNRINELYDAQSNRTLNADEQQELAKLNSDLPSLQDKYGVQRFEDAADIMEGEVDKFYKERPDAEYLKYMYDPGEKKFHGFAGLAAQSYDTKKSDEDIGFVMMTRVGKLSSIEIRGDIEKLLGNFTIEELAEQIDVKSANLKVGTLNRAESVEAVNNFRNGAQYKNDPANNRYIEARLLAITKESKSINGMETPTAVRALAGMMSDSAAVAAQKKYNDKMEEVALGFDQKGDPKNADAHRRVKIEGATPGQILSADEIRQQFASTMSTRNVGQRFAYSTVTSIPTMGSSKNPGEYLSGADPVTGYNPAQQSQSPVSETHRLTTKLIEASAGGQTVSFSALKKSLGGDLQRSGQDRDAIMSTLNWHKVNLAKDMAKALGVELKGGLRSAFVQAMSSLPKNATPADMIAKVREIVPSANPIVNENMQVSLTQPGSNRSVNVSISSVIEKAQQLTATEGAVGVAARYQEVEDHSAYVAHYRNLSEAQAKKNLDEILQPVYDKLRNIDVPHEELMTAMTSAMRKSGFAPAGDMAIEPSQLEENFHRAYVATKAASESYEGGKFKEEKATDKVLGVLDDTMSGKSTTQPQQKTPEAAAPTSTPTGKPA